MEVVEFDAAEPAVAWLPEDFRGVVVTAVKLSVIERHETAAPRDAFGPRVSMILISSWALPGGTIRPKESPEDAARRELEEDSGVVTSELKYFFLFGGANKRHHVFQTSICEDSTPEPRNEIRQCAWFPARRVATLIAAFRRGKSSLVLEGKAGIEMKTCLVTSLMRPSPER
jgi:ADP-ribose pyrophosphatase YjhB (NUDIX family)